MFSSCKSGWFLTLSILSVTFLLYATIGIWFTEWVSIGRYSRAPNALDRYLSAETIDALYEDERIQEAFFKFSTAVAEASSQYGEAQDSEAWKGFGKDLLEEVVRMKTPKSSRNKRELLDRFGNALGFGGAGTAGATGATGAAGAAAAAGGNGRGRPNRPSIIGDLFSQGIAKIGKGLVEGLVTPALFLGIGVGYVKVDISS